MFASFALIEICERAEEASGIKPGTPQPDDPTAALR